MTEQLKKHISRELTKCDDVDLLDLICKLLIINNNNEEVK